MSTIAVKLFFRILLLVRVVRAMCDGSKTCMRVDGVQSEDFEVKVGVHQGVSLEPNPVHYGS